MKKVRARPRRIPAFGEWNYYDDHGGYGYADGDWPVTQYFESAMQLQAGGMVIALPASPKPAKKAVTWSTATMERDEEEQRRQKVVVVGPHGGTKKQTGAGAPVSVSVAGGSHHKASSRRAVKAVDEDLYVIPPDMLCHKPRKRLAKSLWIGGCLGLSCAA